MNFFALLADDAGAPPAVSPEAGSIEAGGILAVLAIACLPVWLLVVRRLQQGRSPWPYEGRRQVPWNGIDVLVVLGLGIFIRLLVAAAFLRASGVPLPTGDVLSPQAVVPALVADGLGEICSLILAVAYLVLRAGAGARSLGFGLRRWRRDLMLGLAAFVFIVPPILALNAVLSLFWAPHHPVIEMVLKNPAALWAATVLVVLIAPLVEEVLFRVVLQGWLERIDRRTPLADRWFGPVTAAALPSGTLPVLLSSALFALLHAGHGPAPIPLFFLGLVLGYVYHQTHRVWPSLVVHAGLNGVTAALLWVMTLNK